MEEQNEINFILTCYPVSQSVKKVFAELHPLLTPVFINVPIFSFNIDRSLKDETEGRPKPWRGGERKVLVSYVNQ